MFEPLDGNKFERSLQFYMDKHMNVCRLLIDSYHAIIADNQKFQSKFEEYLRNILVKKYLRRMKQDKKYSLRDVFFTIESGEIDEITNETKGYIDIQILNIGQAGLAYEDEYFAFECKRLDGKAQKCKAYIENGILRFVSNQYSRLMPLAGMIGFVEQKSPKDNLTKVNHYFKNNTNINTISNPDELEFIPILETFKHSYFSTHKRNSNTDIDLYHLFFDFRLLV